MRNVITREPANSIASNLTHRKTVAQRSPFLKILSSNITCRHDVHPHRPMPTPHPLLEYKLTPYPVFPFPQINYTFPFCLSECRLHFYTHTSKHISLILSSAESCASRIAPYLYQGMIPWGGVELFIFFDYIL